MPKLRKESFGAGDQSWLGSTHGIYNCRTGTLDVSAFTAATHYPDGYIRSGTAVNAADEGAITPFTGAAGEQLGFVYTDQRVVGTEDIPAPILRHGTIRVNRLPVAITPPTGGSPFIFVGTGA